MLRIGTHYYNPAFSRQRKENYIKLEAKIVYINKANSMQVSQAYRLRPCLKTNCTPRPSEIILEMQKEFTVKYQYNIPHWQNEGRHHMINSIGKYKKASGQVNRVFFNKEAEKANS